MEERINELEDEIKRLKLTIDKMNICILHSCYLIKDLYFEVRPYMKDYPDHIPLNFQGNIKDIKDMLLSIDDVEKLEKSLSEKVNKQQQGKE